MSNESPSQEDEMKLAALRKALIEGEQSGEAGPFDCEAFIERMSKKSRGR